jgi:hypothetical protein
LAEVDLVLEGEEWNKQSAMSACAPCKKGKRRCDGGQPCDRCVKGNRREFCHYLAPKKRGRPAGSREEHEPEEVAEEEGPKEKRIVEMVRIQESQEKLLGVILSLEQGWIVCVLCCLLTNAICSCGDATSRASEFVWS